MALFSIPNIVIRAIASAVPANVADNRELALLDQSERDPFVNKVGIRRRRLAPTGVCASDLCVKAAELILNETDATPKEIGALVFVTQTPDFLLPGNSSLVQRRLALSSATYVLDLNQGCAGYVYGLATLSSLMSSTGIKKGLLLVGDTISKVISPNDKSTLPIFSDAGSATLLEHSSTTFPTFFNVGSEGDGASVICIRDGGSRHPFNENSLRLNDVGPGIRRANVHLAMQGVDVVQYTFRYVVPSIMELLDYAGLNTEDPDYFLFHQANGLLNEGLIRKLGVKSQKVPESLADFGNTSSATIPVTINYRLNQQLSNGKHKILLSGFGAGFSWGSAITQVDSIFCPGVIELT